MKNRTFWFLLLAATALSFVVSPARAASFTVKSSPCKGFIRQDKKWAPIAEIPFTSGQEIEGRAVSGRSDIVYWTSGGTDYTVPVKCLASSEAPAPKAAKSAGAPKGAAAPSTYRSRWNVAASLVSWQETVNLSSSDDRIYPLYATQIGTCVGGGYTGSISSSFDFAVDLCGLYLASNLASSGDSASDITYSATGSSIFGVKTDLGAFWHTDSRLFSLGVVAPIAWRMGNWPVPPETLGITYSLEGTSAVLTGVALESRLETGHFLIVPKVGFFGGLSSLLWEVAFGYSF